MTPLDAGPVMNSYGLSKNSTVTIKSIKLEMLNERHGAKGHTV